MNKTNRKETARIIFIFVIAFILLFYVAPGLQESPYNEF